MDSYYYSTVLCGNQNRENYPFTSAECEQPSIKLPALSSPSLASIINKCHDTYGQHMENTRSTCPEGFYVIKPRD